MFTILQSVLYGVYFYFLNFLLGCFILSSEINPPILYLQWLTTSNLSEVVCFQRKKRSSFPVPFYTSFCVPVFLFSSSTTENWINHLWDLFPLELCCSYGLVSLLLFLHTWIYLSTKFFPKCNLFSLQIFISFVFITFCLSASLLIYSLTDFIKFKFIFCPVR